VSMTKRVMILSSLPESAIVCVYVFCVIVKCVGCRCSRVLLLGCERRIQSKAVKVAGYGYGCCYCCGFERSVAICRAVES
jgi:hypothetical protein